MKKHGCGGLLLSTNCLNPTAHTWFKQVGQDPDKPLVLLLQRGRTAPTFPGHWGGPGGLKDEGETGEEAAAREVFEEIGVKFYPDQLAYEGDWKDRRLSYFLGKWETPAILTIQQDEVSGYGWFTVEEALGLPLSFRYREAIAQLFP